MIEHENPLRAAETAASTVIRLAGYPVPEDVLRDALEAYRSVLAGAGLLWTPPDPAPAKAVEEAARRLVDASHHNRYAHPDGWQMLARSPDDVDLAYASAKGYLGRLGGDETTRAELEAARRVLLDHHRTHGEAPR